MSKRGKRKRGARPRSRSRRKFLQGSIQPSSVVSDHDEVSAANFYRLDAESGKFEVAGFDVEAFLGPPQGVNEIQGFISLDSEGDEFGEGE